MTTVQVIVPNKEHGSRNSSDESLQGLSQSECPICLSDDAENVLVRFADCKHIFCQNCLKEYLMTQINNFKVLKIKCPQDGCNVILQESIIKEILDEEAFKRYQTLLLQKINNRGAKPQICPKPGCAKKFTASKDSPYTKCSCGSLICNVCGEFYHEGKNCLQVLDPEFEIYAKENNLKFCVMCKTVINRVEGCLHITCPICDYEWCWICGREYKYQHQPKCPRKWDPLPPLQILRENEPKYWWTEIARFFKALFIFLIKLPWRILLWPFWIFHIWLELRMRHFTKAQKFQKIIIGAFSSFFYCGLLVLIVFMAASADNNGARIVFFVCMGILIPAPWGARLISMLNRHLADKKRKKRWLTRDPNAFGYTDAHRPQNENNQNQQQNNQPQNVEAGSVPVPVIPAIDGQNNQSIEVIVHNHEGEKKVEQEGEKSFERVLPQEPQDVPEEKEENGSEGSEIPLPEIGDMEEENSQDKERGDHEERQSILNIKRDNTSSRLEVSAREVRINVMEIQRSVVEV